MKVRIRQDIHCFDTVISAGSIYNVIRIGGGEVAIYFIQLENGRQYPLVKREIDIIEPDPEMEYIDW